MIKAVIILAVICLTLVAHGESIPVVMPKGFVCSLWTDPVKGFAYRPAAEAATDFTMTCKFLYK